MILIWFLIIGHGVSVSIMVLSIWIFIFIILSIVFFTKLIKVNSKKASLFNDYFNLLPNDIYKQLFDDCFETSGITFEGIFENHIEHIRVYIDGVEQEYSSNNYFEFTTCKNKIRWRTWDL